MQIPDEFLNPVFLKFVTCFCGSDRAYYWVPQSAGDPPTFANCCLTCPECGLDCPTHAKEPPENPILVPAGIRVSTVWKVLHGEIEPPIEWLSKNLGNEDSGRSSRGTS